MKRLYKRVIRKLLNPVVADLTAEIRGESDAIRDLEVRHTQAIHDHLHQFEARLRHRAHAVWRGGLQGNAVGIDGAEIPALTEKYRGELDFWVKLVKHPGAFDNFPWDFYEKYTEWQTGRMNDLADWLGLDRAGEMDRWCAERIAIEVGSGPYPSIAVREWARGYAVDPLAEGYLSEDLPPPSARRLAFIASSGEHVALPASTADIVVIENVLDHCESPKDVLDEIRRLLKPGGLLWLLVDLMDYSDAMHPSPMNEERIRTLLADCGFEVIKDRASTDHKSHGEAYGEYRGLLRKPMVGGSGAQAPEVRVPERARVRT